MAKLSSGNEQILNERSIPYLISKDGTCQIFLGEVEDSEILRPTEKDKEEAENLIINMGQYFKITSLAGMILALLMYAVHSLSIVIFVAIIEITMILVLYNFQKRQNNRILHLISTKIPIERGSKEYIMILEPIQKM